MGARTGTSPLIVIVGPTASGKSELGIELAKRFDGEIVCADALTVRKGVDIGAAKPSKEDRLRVPHHLLDVVEPCQDFTAAVFKDQALRAIEDITLRQKLPIIVGGTGLYVDAVLYDFSFLPAGDRQTRDELNRLSIVALLQIVHEKGLDTSDIDLRNKRRLIRLLETEGARPTRKDLRPHTLVLGIKMSPEEIKQRVAERVDYMLQNGLEQEVRELVRRYGWKCEALKGIGYREWQGYFVGSEDLEQTRSRIIKSTLDLAKRQRTWFKRNNSIHWMHNPSKAVDIVTTFLSKIDK